MDGGIQQLPLSATPVVEVVFEYHLRGTSEVHGSAMTLAGEDYGGPAASHSGLKRCTPRSKRSNSGALLVVLFATRHR